jgi:hypothetical protein
MIKVLLKAPEYTKHTRQNADISEERQSSQDKGLPKFNSRITRVCAQRDIF